MGHRRVVVTGIGVTSALGADRNEFWDALVAGRTGISEMSHFDTSRLSFKNGAEAKWLDSDSPELGEYRSLDRFVQFAILSANEAAQDSGLNWSEELRDKTAVITGSCVGGQTWEDRQFERLYGENAKRLHPLTVPQVMANAGASRICMELGLRGPALTVSTACASSTHALGLAFQMIRSGAAEVAVAGGSDAPLSLGHLKAWEALRVVSASLCRPFCSDRSGTTIGEGGAMMVLETLDAARARGAEIYAEISGFGMSADAYHLTSASLDGPVRAIRAALSDARLDPGQIDYVNAHGTATSTNDVVEAKAIRSVFGAHADRMAVSSTKGAHGHCLGAAGAIEAAGAMMSAQRGIVPPIANFTTADPECELDFVTQSSREQSVGAVLSNSFAFGGLNATLVMQHV